MVHKLKVRLYFINIILVNKNHRNNDIKHHNIDSLVKLFCDFYTDTIKKVMCLVSLPINFTHLL